MTTSLEKSERQISDGGLVERWSVEVESDLTNTWHLDTERFKAFVRRLEVNGYFYASISDSFGQTIGSEHMELDAAKAWVERLVANPTWQGL